MIYIYYIILYLYQPEQEKERSLSEMTGGVSLPAGGNTSDSRFSVCTGCAHFYYIILYYIILYQLACRSILHYTTFIIIYIVKLVSLPAGGCFACRAAGWFRIFLCSIVLYYIILYHIIIQQCACHQLEHKEQHAPATDSYYIILYYIILC